MELRKTYSPFSATQEWIKKWIEVTRREALPPDRVLAMQNLCRDYARACIKMHNFPSGLTLTRSGGKLLDENRTNEVEKGWLEIGNRICAAYLWREYIRALALIFSRFLFYNLWVVAAGGCSCRLSTFRRWVGWARFKWWYFDLWEAWWLLGKSEVFTVWHIGMVFGGKLSDLNWSSLSISIHIVNAAIVSIHRQPPIPSFP